MSGNKLLFRLCLSASALALVVIVLGAYVRLSHAGLGCPDWPGCYGHLDVPATAQEIDRANAAYPERQVEQAKAWKEMMHRYFATGLGLLIVAIFFIAFKHRQNLKEIQLPLVLLLLVIFQGMLGMWTVTLLLKPIVVTAHLLGGMTTLALLWWLTLLYSDGAFAANIGRPSDGVRSLQRYVLLCLVALVLQIFLGGWTSTNYAALACYGFPGCNQQWWPAMDFKNAFVFWRGLGINYEGGVLQHSARTAIHMTHRIGALVVAVLLIMLACRVYWSAVQHRVMAWLLIAVLCMQIGLGVANVTLGLPLWVATAHNAGAVLLLLVLLSLFYRLRYELNSNSVRV